MVQRRRCPPGSRGSSWGLWRALTLVLWPGWATPATAETDPGLGLKCYGIQWIFDFPRCVQTNPETGEPLLHVSCRDETCFDSESFDPWRACRAGECAQCTWHRFAWGRKAVQLSWHTSTEPGFERYVVLRSSDGGATWVRRAVIPHRFAPWKPHSSETPGEDPCVDPAKDAVDPRCDPVALESFELEDEIPRARPGDRLLYRVEVEGAEDEMLAVSEEILVTVGEGGSTPESGKPTITFLAPDPRLQAAVDRRDFRLQLRLENRTNDLRHGSLEVQILSGEDAACQAPSPPSECVASRLFWPDFNVVRTLDPEHGYSYTLTYPRPQSATPPRGISLFPGKNILRAHVQSVHSHQAEPVELPLTVRTSPIDPAKLLVFWPEGDGGAVVVGLAGAADPGLVLTVRNETTGAILEPAPTAKGDGGWLSEIEAVPGDRLSVAPRGEPALGTEVEVPEPAAPVAQWQGQVSGRWRFDLRMGVARAATLGLCRDPDLSYAAEDRGSFSFVEYANGQIRGSGTLSEMPLAVDAALSCGVASCSLVPAAGSAAAGYRIHGYRSGPKVHLVHQLPTTVELICVSADPSYGATDTHIFNILAPLKEIRQDWVLNERCELELQADPSLTVGWVGNVDFSWLGVWPFGARVIYEGGGAARGSAAGWSASTPLEAEIECPPAAESCRLTEGLDYTLRAKLTNPDAAAGGRWQWQAEPPLTRNWPYQNFTPVGSELDELDLRVDPTVAGERGHRIEARYLMDDRPTCQASRDVEVLDTRIAASKVDPRDSVPPPGVPCGPPLTVPEDCIQSEKPGLASHAISYRLVNSAGDDIHDAFVTSFPVWFYERQRREENHHFDGNRWVLTDQQGWTNDSGGDQRQWAATDCYHDRGFWLVLPGQGCDPPQRFFQWWRVWISQIGSRRFVGPGQPPAAPAITRYSTDYHYGEDGRVWCRTQIDGSTARVPPLPDTPPDTAPPPHPR